MKTTINIKENNTEKHFVPLHSGTELQGIQKKLFLDRYSLKDENGNSLEHYPEQTWKRVAWAIAQAEKTPKLKKLWEEKFYEIMTDFKFSPGGRFLTAAGTGSDATMINCYVIPDPEDTRSGIIKTLEYVTEISARGGGVGFNISSLRPRGSYLKAVNGTSSGAVSWANLYSVATHDIIQQGGTRRGALMIMMWDWHPDLEEFITIKKEQGKIQGANLSVCISDAFMEAVKNDLDWQLKFPDTGHENYRKEWKGDIEEWEKNGNPIKVYKTLKARDLWKMICESAWASAEPGVVFMDRYNKMNNTWYFEKNVSVNVCGEQGLPAWGVCNLGSINLASFVENGEFNFEKYDEVIKTAVRFLDDAIDTEKYLYREIEETQERERRQGLGTMGLADALIKMKIRYGSEESLRLIDKIYEQLRDTAYNTSIELAKEKGGFPMFEAKKYLQSGFIRTLPSEITSKIKKYGIRNALILTEAPTGKISMLAGVSSGIEPIFSFSYIQTDRLGERTVFHPVYQEWIDQNGKDTIPSYFVVADDLTPEEHIKVQALIQKYTDSSISKTVNAPKTHTIEDVEKLYQLAYESGCKGISYMRDGSREGTLIRQESKDKKEESNEKVVEINKPVIWERPTKVIGATYRLKTPVGTAFITVNHDELGSPVELFINIGRAGSDVQAMAEALGRLISKSLRSSDHLSTRERAVLVIEQLMGIGGARTVGFGQTKIFSLPDAVAKALAMDMGLLHNREETVSENGNGISNGLNNHLETNSHSEQLSIDVSSHDHSQLHFLSPRADICPQCGNATLVHEMGCKTCHSCGYSEC